LDRILSDLVAAACHLATAPLAAEVASLRRALEERMPVVFLSRAEAAEQLDVSIDTVDKMVRDGRLVARRAGRAVRIDPRSLRLQADAEVSTLAFAARQNP
jgi:excisionase family DNA binding protein